MDPTLTWLLEGDPAIRWQTMATLLEVPDADVATERARVAEEGWGARLLAAQDPDGTWGGGLYSPKWTSTTYTLLLLRRCGLLPHPRAETGARILLDRAAWLDGGVSYWKTHREPELCVNGMVLSVCAHFHVDDDRLAGVADMLLRRQLADGGWNCDRKSDGHHSSFHTTISVLEGLHARALQIPHDADRLRTAMERAWGFFADHRLFRSHRTGEVIEDDWTRFSFPPRWHYDVLRGLDHLAACDAPRDDRYAEGVELVHRRRNEAGRWKLQNRYRGHEHFLLEPGRGDSRWNTLRALRVLRWWSGGR